MMCCWSHLQTKSKRQPPWLTSMATVFPERRPRSKQKIATLDERHWGVDGTFDAFVRDTGAVTVRLMSVIVWCFDICGFDVHCCIPTTRTHACRTTRTFLASPAKTTKSQENFIATTHQRLFFRCLCWSSLWFRLKETFSLPAPPPPPVHWLSPPITSQSPTHWCVTSPPTDVTTMYVTPPPPQRVSPSKVIGTSLTWSASPESAMSFPRLRSIFRTWKGMFNTPWKYLSELKLLPFPKTSGIFGKMTRAKLLKMVISGASVQVCANLQNAKTHLAWQTVTCDTGQ